MKINVSSMFRIVVVSVCFCANLPLVGKEKNRGKNAVSQQRAYSLFGHPEESLHIARHYLPENPVIIEAGAFDGRESCILAAYWPRGHIHSFEPVPELFDGVKNRVKHVSNVSVYNIALGTHSGYQTFYLSSYNGDTAHVSQSSSLYPPKEHLVYSDVVFPGTMKVAVTTMDTWAAQYGIEKVDMLWLDMQGAELAALKAAPKLLSRVSVILTELEFVEAYAEQPLYEEVKSWLESQGFVLIAGNFDFPKDPNQWFGDGLFVRKELLGNNLR